MTPHIILAFVRVYLPGFKSGGPVRTIANMVEALGGEFEFRIVTSDRDILDSQPYGDCPRDEWTRIGKSWVYYTSPEKRGYRYWGRLLHQQTYDMLYFNSLFDPTFTLKPLLARRLLGLESKPAIVAPRGELYAGALGLKRWKKSPFLAMAKICGLYRDVLWHASSEQEAALIHRHFHEKEKILIARNLPAQTPRPSVAGRLEQSGGPLRMVFLSRISRKKNLDYALRVLSRCDTAVRLDIWGTIEDASYWGACQKLLREMPNHVQVCYRGVADHEDVPDILSRYDLFFLPTRGENYGHAIAEALSVGTPVLISDQTPWRRLTEHGVGWDLPLDEDGAVFLRAIETASRNNSAERGDWRERVYQYALTRLTDPRILTANRDMFAMAMRLGNGR